MVTDISRRECVQIARNGRNRGRAKISPGSGVSRGLRQAAGPVGAGGCSGVGVVGGVGVLFDVVVQARQEGGYMA